MELYVYSTALELLGVVGHYQSLRWRRKYFEPGEIELHVPITRENLSMLTPGQYIIQRDAVEGAVITGIQLSGNDMTVTGRMLGHLLSRRVVYPQMRFSGAAEVAIYRIVQQNAIDARPIPLLVCKAAAGFPEAADFDTLGVNCADALTIISKASGIGCRVRPDIPSKRLVFEAYQGTDRSIEQTVNPRVTLSDAYLSDPAYTYDSSLYRNFAYVFTGAETVTVDMADGGERYELWVNGNDINAADYGSTAEYRAALRQRGLDRLAELPISEAFESSLQSAELGYKTDWDLGDIVTVRMSAWDKVASVRVSEVEEIYEGGTVEVIPVLGSSLPEKLTLGDGF